MSIASRKAGTFIDCPKCNASQEVPSQEAGDAAISLAMASEVEEKANDGPANELEETRQSVDILPTPPLPVTPLDIPTPEDVKTHAPARDDYILLSRRTIYLQGVLFIVVALLALGMGFLIGRGGVTENASNADGSTDSAEADPVLLEGCLTFESAAGAARPDHNAVIIVLPERTDLENTQPDERIPSPGIRSLDPPPAEDYGSLRRIRASGGCYARADEEGRFSLVLPDSGRYHLLLISRGAARTDGSEVDAADLEEIAGFFRRPAYLIGERKYRLTLEKFDGRAQLEHNFELSR